MNLLQWIMRADARKVFLSLLAIIALVTAWWTWRAFAPMEAEAVIPQAAGKEKSVSTLGIVAFLDQQSARASTPPESLFPSSGHSDSTPQPKTRNTQQSSQQIKPQSKPEALTLTYRGMFQGTDGKAMALMEDLKAKTTTFYASGQELHGFKIGEIGGQRVVMAKPGGDAVFLKVGTPKNF